MLQLSPAVRSRRLCAAAVLLTTAAGCGGGGSDGGVVAPPASKTTATVTVPAQITVPSSVGALSVQVVASYDRTHGGAGALSSQSVAIPGTGAQTVPFTVDLASCLADTARVGAATTACTVRVQLTLLGGTTALDAQSVGPLVLAPGSAVTASPGVTFASVATVQIVGAPNAARVLLGAPLGLSAQAFDAAGAVLAGRAARWSSSAPNVATVDSITGVVTPVAVGSTSVTATIAGHAGVRTVNVVGPPQQIAVTAAGGFGSGSVTSNPGGYSCRVSNGAASGTCAASFASDSVVTLTAVPDAGSSFGTWGGACASFGSARVCTLTPAAAQSATVTFLAPRTFTITPTGSGSGVVTSTPAPISCHLTSGTASGTCSGVFSDNLTLTATADAGSTFTGWTGGCLSQAANATCTVTAEQAQGIGAVFTANQIATVRLNTTGAGGGLVTTSQVGGSGAISCHRIGSITAGAVCSSEFASGSQITLTASPDALSTFDGWTGACSSSGPTCVVTLGTTEAVPVAAFGASPTANGVSVAPTGTGSGSLTILTTIVSAPCDRAQVNRPDGGTCIAPWNPTFIPPGGAVLTAKPAAGSRFTGWINCPAASGTSCTVPRNGVSAVAASFDP